jgi:uncharacterized protein involved in exopolysaccharide biosynthesis
MNVQLIIIGLRRHFRLFALVVGACAVLSVVGALLARPLYRAEVTVAPVSDEGAMSALGGLASQFGGLASFAGVGLGKGRNWDEAIAVLRSRHLVEELVRREGLIPVLFPRKAGLLDMAATRTKQPTIGDAVLRLQRSVMQVREDTKSGLVTVRVDWFDPQLAANWANEIVAMADAELREKAISDATLSLNTLQHQLETTEAVELRGAISRLMETELKSKMVAGVRAEYAYRVIDKAVPADLDKRVQPTRTIMVLAGTLAGVFLGLVTVGIRAQVSKSSGE